MKLNGITTALIAAISISTTAQAEKPFSFEGKWVSGRLEGNFRKNIEITNCSFKSCDFHYYHKNEPDFCEFNGKLEKQNSQNGHIIIEIPQQTNAYCIISIKQALKNTISIKSQNCNLLCRNGRLIDGEYEKQDQVGYYPTGYDCQDERITYAEAAICRNRLLSLGHQETIKLQKKANFNASLIKEWEQGRNFCQTETQCLKQKYQDYIEALSKKISGKEFNLQTYYQQTQGGYGSPFESFMTYKKIQEGLSVQAQKEYESLMGERVNRSQKDYIFVSYIPQDNSQKEKAAFYLKDNEMWIGYIGMGSNNLEEIFLYAPKNKKIIETPKAIQEWEKKFQNINCLPEEVCIESLYPTINFSPTL